VIGDGRHHEKVFEPPAIAPRPRNVSFGGSPREVLCRRG